MKRRKFIKSATGVVVGGVATTLSSSALSAERADRPLGRPDYLTDGFQTEMNYLRLSMSRGNMPVEVWDDIVRYQTAWESLKVDANSKALFHADPVAWLQSHGMPEDMIHPDDREIKLLQAVYANPDFMSFAADYNSFAQYLRSAGILDPAAPQHLSTRIRQAIRGNREEIARIFESSKTTEQSHALSGMPLLELEKLVTEFNNLSEYTKGNLVVVLPINVVVGVNLILAVNVVIAVALVVTLAVSVSVEVAGEGGDQLVGPSTSSTAARNPLLQKLMSFDEQTKQDLAFALRAAQFAPHQDLEVEILRDFLETETRVVLEACELEKLISLPEDVDIRNRYIELAGKVTTRMVGLPDAAIAA